MKRRWGVVLAVLLLAVLGGLGWRAFGASGKAEDWVTVQREDLVLTADVTGTLLAVDTDLLGPPQVLDQWNFKLAFLAPEGKEVRKGTPVMRFDTAELERKRVEKAAELDSAEQELAKRRVSLEIALRDRELALAEAEAKRRKAALKVDVPSDLVAAQELAQSRIDLALAEKEAENLRGRLRFDRLQGQSEIASLTRRRDLAAAKLAEIGTMIGKMTVAAPRDGTVVYVSNRQGEKKKVGDSVWQAERVIEIPSLSRLKAEGEIDEADFGRIAVGQPVALRLDAHPDVGFTGRVRAIRSALQEKKEESGVPRKVGVLDIELARTDPQRMRPGMRFRGTVEIARVAGAVVVPSEAVLATAAGPRVFRRSWRGAEAVTPRLGRRNPRWVQILAGLEPGERVAARPAELEEGTR